MSSEWAIRTSGLAKCYALFDRPSDRLKQMLWRGRRKYFREFWALRNVDLEVGRGEVLGIVGRNGAGKSTLLQLICGTLTPTAGSVQANGRVAALLELGAGFNPEFSGRENVHLAASVLGLTPAEIEARFDEIVEFSGIADFIDQPVKTYSSGMYIRLAFSIATSIDPDILIIDEALSVGDGVFARKSFDRIMALKDAGKTILFCSHSMYQIDVLCQRALWLEHGCVRMLGEATQVTSAYTSSLELDSSLTSESSAPPPRAPPPISTSLSSGRIVRVSGSCDGTSGLVLDVKSQISTVAITMDFFSTQHSPPPTIAFAIENASGSIVSSVISSDPATVAREKTGYGHATAVFPKIPLLKGEFRVSAFLACERAVLPYDSALHCLTLNVSQKGATQGIVVLPHQWQETS